MYEIIRFKGQERLLSHVVQECGKDKYKKSGGFTVHGFDWLSDI